MEPAKASGEPATGSGGSLLLRVARGDRDAVPAVLATYGSLVWTMARRMGGPRDQLEDAVQEVFIDLWRSAHRFDPKLSSEKTFVATIARRRLIDQCRRRGNRPASAPLAEANLEAMDARLDGVELTDEARHAARALMRLLPEQRTVVVLSVRDGLSHSQIADHLRMPLGTVKSHLRRGLDRVHRILLGEGRGRPEVTP